MLKSRSTHLVLIFNSPYRILKNITTRSRDVSLGLRLPRHTLLPSSSTAFPVNAVAAFSASGDPNDGSRNEGERESQSRILNNRSTTANEDWIAKLLRWLHTAATAAAVVVSLALATFGLSPYILSHPFGLNTALGIANVAAPVRIEVDSIHAGWQRPVTINGVKIFEKQKKFSRPQERNEEQTVSKSDSEDAKEARLLFSLDKLKTTASLWNILLSSTGTRRFSSMSAAGDVILSSPKVDVTLDPSSGNIRIAEVLQNAGLAPRPRKSKLINSSVAFESSALSGRASASHSGSDNKNNSKKGAPTASIKESLTRVSAQIPFSGEIRAGTMHIALQSGTLLAPEEFQDLFSTGDSKQSGTGVTHFEVLLGTEIIEEDALDQYTYPVENDQAAAAAAAAVENNNSIEKNTPEQQQQQEDKFVDKVSTDKVVSKVPLVEWATQRPRITLPSDVGAFTSPVALRFDSSAIKLQARGWRTSSGYTYLTDPITAELDLKPDLATVLLKRLNPLLGDVITLQESSKVDVSILSASEDNLWPSAGVNVQLEPLKVTVGQGAAVTKALGALKLMNSKVGAAVHAANLTLDLSQLRAEITAEGGVKTRPLDIHVGVPGLVRPLKLCSWGDIAADGHVDYTVAVPAESLEILGVPGLPAEFALTIAVRGTMQEGLKVDLMEASKKVALLVIESKAKAMGPRSGEWLWEELRLGGGGSSSSAAAAGQQKEGPKRQ